MSFTSVSMLSAEFGRVSAHVLGIICIESKIYIYRLSYVLALRKKRRILLLLFYTAISSFCLSVSLSLVKLSLFSSTEVSVISFPGRKVFLQLGNHIHQIPDVEIVVFSPGIVISSPG